ncbi:hypothetical protein NMG60_11022868 [Bertholletia excelsa]
MELQGDKTGLQRSEQLRDLYQCLLGKEADQRQASASLSPDDLTDAEWYYLVCMSFVFKPEVLLSVWSWQTVICFPHLGGVIELGVTELVGEDPSFIQHVKTFLLEFSKPVCSKKSSFAPHNGDHEANCMARVGHDIQNSMTLEILYCQTEDIRFVKEEEPCKLDDLNMSPPDECSNGSEDDHQAEESLFGGASQVQSWHFMEDDLSTLNSGNFISQVFPSQGKAVYANNLKELQNGYRTKFSSLDHRIDGDLHCRRTLPLILKDSTLLLKNLYVRTCNYKSSCSIWKKGEGDNGNGSQVKQKMKKKILFDGPFTCAHGSLKSQEENVTKDWSLKPDSDEICLKHAWADKNKEYEIFLVLRIMVPSISKVDKVTNLGDTIEYLKELEARVEELESCIHLAKQEAPAGRTYPDVEEPITENSNKKQWINKRKACDIHVEEPEVSIIVPKDKPVLSDTEVKIKEQEVLIEIRCQWKELLLLNMMEAVNNLKLDAHSVQSSINNGVLTLTLQSKLRGAAVASEMMIKQAILAIAGES